MMRFTSAYVQDLEERRLRNEAALRAEREAQRQEKERREAQGARERLTPLDDRLARHLATIPKDVQCEGLSLSTLQVSIRGRRRGHAHPGEIGDALRRLGFVRKRRWDGDAGFKALWYPTEESDK